MEKNPVVQINDIDYRVPQTGSGFGEKHFCIFYEPAENVFKIIDLFDGTGTFVLLSESVVLGTN